MGELPPERMREAVEAELIAAADDMAGWLRGRLRTAESEPLWREMRAALDRYEAAADAYAVDSRPSLDLTEQELGAIHELAACEAGLLAPDDAEFRLLDGIVGKVSAELARRQGTGQ